MVDLNNPADRLREQMMRVYDMRASNPHLAAVDAWGRAWDLDWHDPAEFADLFERAAGLVSLGAEVRRAAEEYGPLGVSLLEHFDEVEQTLSNFGLLRSHNLEHFFNPLQATGQAALRNLTALLAGRRPTLELSTSQRDSIVQQVRDVIDRLRDDGDLDLTDEERLTLIDKLRDVEERLIRVEVLGAEDLQAASDALIGGLFRVFWHRGADFIRHPAVQLAFAVANSVSALIGIPADALQLAQMDLTSLLELTSGDDS